MKSRIISLGLVASLVCLLPQVAEAQIAASNPLEWTALAEGNELINEQIEKQIIICNYSVHISVFILSFTADTSRCN